MSGGHWGYMAEKLREQAHREKAVWEALGDLESVVDWAESGDTSRLSDPVGWHEQFAVAVRAALDSSDGISPSARIARIAQARALLDRRLSGEEHERWAADVLASTGRVVGPSDPRGAEAEAYDRLCKLFDELQGGFGWGR